MDTILFQGPKRSGNHLVINWLMGLYDNPCFHNGYFVDLDAVKTRQILRANNKADKEGHDVVIFSCEYPVTTEQETQKVIKRVDRGFVMYLLRNPFNWLASWLHNDGIIQFGTVERAYTELSDQLFEQWLAHFKIWEQASIKITYQNFVSSVKFRQSLADKLGRKFDKEIDSEKMNTLWHHPAIHQPSSFDTAKVNKRQIQAREMAVLERYKTIVPLLENVPSEIKEASKLFGLDYATIMRSE